jgi:hypothetical protein
MFPISVVDASTNGAKQGYAHPQAQGMQYRTHAEDTRVQ